MLWGTLGYLFLFIFRPFEYWIWLEKYHVERVYIICLIIAIILWFLRGKHYVHHPITNAFLTFFLVICFSVIIAYRPEAAIREAEEYFKLIVLFFVIILTVKDENDFRFLILGFIAITSCYVGKSLWEFHFNDMHAYRMGIRRLIGLGWTYSDPNTFAASVVYSFPFAWALWKSDTTKWLRAGLIGYGLMSAIAIMFTGSRSGMVTLVLFAILVCSTGKLKTPYKIIGLVGVAIILVSAWQFVPDEYKQRYFTIIDDSINRSATESAEGRIEGLKNGLRLFASSPFWGWGSGNFRYAVETIGVYNRMQSHNLYGQLAADLGLLGIAAFIAICWMIFRTNRFIQKSARSIGLSNSNKIEIIASVSSACMNTMILLLFQGLFGHNLYRYTWLLIGAILVLGHNLVVKRITEETQLRFKAYQLILCTRFNKPIFVEAVVRPIRDLVRQICSSMACVMLRFGISHDRITVLVALPKHQSIRDFAKIISLKTSQKLFSEIKNLKDEFSGQDIWEKTSIISVPNEVVAKLIVLASWRKKRKLHGDGNMIDLKDILPPSIPASQPPGLR